MCIIEFSTKATYYRVLREVLRDLITKRGENSPPIFFTDFLFSSLSWATYVGVLENIKSLALGPKSWAQEDYLLSMPESWGFSYLNIMPSGSLGLKDEKST